MIAYFDETLGITGFEALFENTVCTQRYCRSCERFDDNARSVVGAFQLQLHPMDPTIHETGLDIYTMLSAALRDVDVSWLRCPETGCAAHRQVSMRNDPHIASSGDILKLEVVWGLAGGPEHPAAIARNDKVFTIPKILRLDSSPNTPSKKHQWTLAGIIVRRGEHTQRGHYSAIVSHDGLWYHVDDDRVQQVHSATAAAFMDGAYPYLILYQKQQTADESAAVADVARDEAVGPSLGPTTAGDGMASLSPHVTGDGRAPTNNEVGSRLPISSDVAESRDIDEAQPNATPDMPYESDDEWSADYAYAVYLRSRGIRAIDEPPPLSPDSGLGARSVDTVSDAGVPAPDPGHAAPFFGPCPPEFDLAVPPDAVRRNRMMRQRLDSVSALQDVPTFNCEDAVLLCDTHQYPGETPALSDSFFQLCQQHYRQHQSGGATASHGFSYDSIPSTLPGADVPVAKFLELQDRETWWSTAFMDAVGMLAASSSARSPLLPDVVYLPHFLRWNRVPVGDNFIDELVTDGDVDGSSVPFPWLGMDPGWRNRVTVGAVSVKNRTHYATMVIDGPRRMVLLYDGYGGTLDSHEVEAVSI